jgi:hypothetical protein
MAEEHPPSPKRGVLLFSAWEIAGQARNDDKKVKKRQSFQQ